MGDELGNKKKQDEIRQIVECRFFLADYTLFDTNSSSVQCRKMAKDAKRHVQAAAIKLLPLAVIWLASSPS